MYKINHANIKEWAANYEGELFDGILCDPPYELGFMGKSWDSSGIAFDADMWADILKLLKPGGHLLAFSGSRTYHRMAVAIEDAGFEIRDMIEWVYGSGFPKSLDVSKALDKSLGYERQDILQEKPKNMDNEVYGKGLGVGILERKPASDEAKIWNGYGTALKPAHEPCVLARKPLDGTVANNVLKHGTGGLNIDGTRIATTETWKNAAQDIRGGNLMGKAGRHPDLIKESNSLGRFPANLIHDGSDEVVGLFPETKSGSMMRDYPRKPVDGWGMSSTYRTVANSGSASRFFYTAKASKSERNAGLEGFEEVANPNRGAEKRITVGGGKVNHLPRANHHPTVKPLSLTKYLATLIKPPTGGRLLVPFSGSGSEMIGALQAGWEYVEGVELTEEYIPIAEARIKYWLEKQDKQVTLNV